jgi:predicted DNA-binding transcriptional regulator AlpA
MFHLMLWLTARVICMVHDRDDSLILNVKEAATRLRLSRTTLWRLREELRPIRLSPRRFGYAVKDIERFIESRRQETA